MSVGQVANANLEYGLSATPFIDGPALCMRLSHVTVGDEDFYLDNCYKYISVDAGRVSCDAPNVTKATTSWLDDLQELMHKLESV